MPDVIVVGDVALPEELLDLWMTVGDNAIKSYTTCTQQCQTPLQAFFLHVVATTNLIALSPHHKNPKINSIRKCIMDIHLQM